MSRFAKLTRWPEPRAHLVEKNQTSRSLRYITQRFLSLRGGLLFRSYKYQKTNFVHIFPEANELNIAFPFVILMSQNYI